MSAKASPASEDVFPAEFDLAFGAAFERQVERSTGRIAIAGPAGGLTYDELNRRANRLARWIAEQSPRSGSDPLPVALLLASGKSAITGMIAAHKSGRPALPLDSNAPLEMNAFILGDAGAAILVADAKSREVAATLAARAGIRALDAESVPPSTSEANLSVEISSTAPSTILYTSGTTGRPKGLFHVHRHHVRSALLQARRLGMTADDRFLLVSATAFGATNGVLYPALLNGASIWPFDLATLGFEAFARWLDAERITIYQSVPAVFRRLAAAISPGNRISAIRLLRLSGDALFREDFELYRRHFANDCRLRVTLASTEAGSITEFLADKDTQFHGPVVPAGSPLPGMEVRILGEDLRELPPGEVGEIEVASPFLAGGYWRDPARTADRFRPDPRRTGWRVLRTGDLGRWRDDGLLEHRGRADLQLKIRGYRVDVTAVEAHLRGVPGVREAVVAAYDEGENRRLAAYLEISGGTPPLRSDLRRLLRERVPESAVPAAFVYLESLPKTLSGKTDRRALSPPTGGDYADVSESPPPRDDVERELLDIWRRILPGTVSGVGCNFFDSGGDSLAAAELLSAIELRFGQRFALPVLLEYPTIDALARRLRHPDRTDSGSPLVALRATGTQPPFFCVPGGNGPGFNFRPLSELLGGDQPFYAFHVATEAGAAMPATIREWVDRFLPELRRVQPRGPYRLGGHSFGGMIAYAMAERLAREGETIELLVLFDVFAPGYPRVLSTRERRIQLWRDFARRSSAEKLRTVRRTLGRALDRMAGRPKPIQKGWFGKGELGRSLRSYKPGPIAAPIVLFRATEREVWRGFSFDDSNNGWSELAGERLRVHAVAGKHGDFIVSEGLEIIARILKGYFSNSPASRTG